jgi:hypothetical protein
MNKLFVFFLALIFSAGLKAQPSAEQVKKDAIGNGNGVISFKLTKSTGTRQWNSDIGNWEYVRGVEVKRKSEFAGINLIVTGNVVYQYTGVGKYSYWKFRVVSNEYEGLPNPTASEIEAFLSKNWGGFFGYYFGKIVTLHQPPVLAADPGWTWHNPKSVEFKMKTKFDHIISNTEVETLESIWNVRLYRDEIKGEWKNMSAGMSNNSLDNVVIEKKKFTESRIADMEKQTLAYTMGEEMARKKLAAMPRVDIPEFTSAQEMVKFIHAILRNGTPEEFKTVMIKVLGPRHFEEGSSVQLSMMAEKKIDDIIMMAYKDKATYKQQYCQQLMVKAGMSSSSHFYISACINDVASLFVVEPYNMGYKEGVEQKKLKLSDIEIRVRQDDNAINFINSFSDRKKLCPND